MVIMVSGTVIRISLQIWNSDQRSVCWWVSLHRVQVYLYAVPWILCRKSLYTDKPPESKVDCVSPIQNMVAIHVNWFRLWNQNVFYLVFGAYFNRRQLRQDNSRFFSFYVGASK